MSDRPKLDQLTLPEAVARFPALLDYDEYQLKEHGKYIYKTDLILDPSDAESPWTFVNGETKEVIQGEGVADFVEKITELSQDAFDFHKERLQNGNGKDKAKVKKMELYVPFEPEYDEEGEETGRLIFKTKMTGKGTNKKTGKDWEREVPLYDSEGEPVKGKNREGLKLWGGSRLIVATEAFPFFNESNHGAGISLRMGAVQIVEAVGGGGNRSAESFGFGVVAGGYKTDTFDSAMNEDSGDDVSDASEEDDF